MWGKIHLYICDLHTVSQHIDNNNNISSSSSNNNDNVNESDDDVNDDDDDNNYDSNNDSAGTDLPAITRSQDDASAVAQCASVCQSGSKTEGLVKFVFVYENFEGFVHVYMYVCVCMHACVCVCVWVHTCAHCVCVHMCTHACMSVCHVCVFVCIQVRLCQIKGFFHDTLVRHKHMFSIKLGEKKKRRGRLKERRRE